MTTDAVAQPVRIRRGFHHPVPILAFLVGGYFLHVAYTVPVDAVGRWYLAFIGLFDLAAGVFAARGTVLYLGTRYIETGGVIGALRTEGGWPSEDAGDQDVDLGSLIRLKDIIRVERKGRTLFLVHWHHAKRTRISLWWLTAATRRRLLDYLTEKIGPIEDVQPLLPRE